MDRQKHRILLVEDDTSTREELEEILGSLDCDVVSCGDRQTALQHLAVREFCMAVLDLEIFGEPGASKPREDHGRSLLREVRRAYPDYTPATGFTFPILVISGYADEWDAAKGVTQDGASEIVRKPPRSGEVSSAVRACLVRSGRRDHNDCASKPGRAATELELSIPATRIGQRADVRLGGRSAPLPDNLLEVLLQLVKGRLQGRRVHKIDMGDTGTGGFKKPSRLNAEMKPAYPPGVTCIVKNYRNGEYSLLETVTLGPIDTTALADLNHSGITKLAQEIAVLRSNGNGSS